MTATAGLTSGKVTVDSPTYPVVTSYTPPLTSKPISNFDGNACGGTLLPILARSCNSSFAQMAAETTGPDPMIDAAEAAGFNQPVELDLPRPARSVYPTDFGAVVSRPGGFGSGLRGHARWPRPPSARTTCHAAADGAVAAGAGNTGRMATSHVMAEIRARNGDVVESSLLPVEGVDDARGRGDHARGDGRRRHGGTAAVMATPGWEVGAKTGTAPEPSRPARTAG